MAASSLPSSDPTSLATPAKRSTSRRARSRRCPWRPSRSPLTVRFLLARLLGLRRNPGRSDSTLATSCRLLRQRRLVARPRCRPSAHRPRPSRARCEAAEIGAQPQRSWTATRARRARAGAVRRALEMPSIAASSAPHAAIGSVTHARVEEALALAHGTSRSACRREAAAAHALDGACAGTHRRPLGSDAANAGMKSGHARRRPSRPDPSASSGWDAARRGAHAHQMDLCADAMN